jgi:molybdate transport system regulatory protein
MDINKINKVQGIIEQVATDGHISLAIVSAGSDSFTALTYATPESAEWLQNGKMVNLTFKAGDMAIAKLFSGEISIRNYFPATVTGVEAGNVLTEIILDYKGQTLYAVITNNAATALALKEGDEVTGLVKSTELAVNYE